jgi:AraC family transcriptional regulator of adaptative response / DNA-3-methyladenine glycosylase II
VELNHAACYRVLSRHDRSFDGRIFSCVKTTRIYCRPSCTAKLPRSENILFVSNAYAAHALGFRPCLKCRPELAPELAVRRGTPTAVMRALAEMELEGLDGEDVQALAERAGVSESELLQLFEEHVGASPNVVAETRRVLLAKQLMHDTQLPLADVARASGFESTKRFQDTFRKLFRRPASELRRGRAAAVSGEVQVRLPYQPPYDWEAMAGWFAKRAIPGVEQVRDGVYARTIALDGQFGILRVEPASGDALRATIRFPDLAALPRIRARLRRMFDLAADSSSIGEHLATDPLLAPLVAARPGLRVPGVWDGFELAIRAVLGQQITVVAARTLAGRLVATCGHALKQPDGTLSHAFPTPAALASADLSKLGVPRSRAAALHAVAAAAVADPELFRDRGELEDAVKRLREIRGVGEWTAQYIALRQMRQPDAFPATDLGILRGLSVQTGRKSEVRDLLSRAERWRPWRAYAAQHLWAVG